MDPMSLWAAVAAVVGAASLFFAIFTWTKRRGDARRGEHRIEVLALEAKVEAADERNEMLAGSLAAMDSELSRLHQTIDRWIPDVGPQDIDPTSRPTLFNQLRDIRHAVGQLATAESVRLLDDAIRANDRGLSDMATKVSHLSGQFEDHEISDDRNFSALFDGLKLHRPGR